MSGARRLRTTVVLGLCLLTGGCSVPITDRATWSLAAPADKWEAEMPLGALAPQRTYTLFGGTQDNSWSASGVSFTTAELEAREPGQVLYRPGDESAESYEANVVESEAQFFESACAPLGG